MQKWKEMLTLRLISSKEGEETDESLSSSSEDEEEEKDPSDLCGIYKRWKPIILKRKRTKVERIGCDTCLKWFVNLVFNLMQPRSQRIFV